MISKTAVTHYLYLLIFAVSFLLLFLIADRISPGLVPPEKAVPLLSSFALISLTALVVFFLGSVKNPERSVFMTLIALGVKMLLSFVLALLWFLVFKNRGTGSVLMFFILYLGFTLFVVLSFFRVLKHKKL
jgi:hypothetical protein